MKGWLVNDCLTCIPGTKTFWHDLLEWFSFLEDKTFGYTQYDKLSRRVEEEAKRVGPPDFIVRNATYFGRIRLPSKTISLLQDYCPSQTQIDVCNNSKMVVFNSPYTAEKYKSKLQSPTIIIPIGTDFDHFKPLNKEEMKIKWGILPDSVLFIGANSSIKGFSVLLSIISESSFNFCLVMKDDFKMSHPRVKVFNKVNHQNLVEIINACSILVCTSTSETLHLAGVEAAACGLPLVTTDVGVYFGLQDGKWGKKTTGNWNSDIQSVLDNLSSFDSRGFFMDLGLDKNSCRSSWHSIIEKVNNESNI